MENYPDFKKLARVLQHGGLYLKISKVSPRRETILVIFCRGGSVTLIPNVTKVFTKLNPSRGNLKPLHRITKSQKERIFFLYGTVEKMIHQKKNRGHRTSKAKL